MANPRGIPSAYNRRGRKKKAPPPARNAHIYRDLRDEAIKVDVGAMEVTVDPGPDGDLGTDDDKVTVAPKKSTAKKAAEAVKKVLSPKKAKPDVSMDNTKDELLKAAKKMKLDVPKSATKAEILTAIEDA